MENYNYVATFEHGSAEGTIRADSAKEAKAKVTDMYQGLRRDTIDARGEPTTEATVVTNVKITLVKE